MNRPCETCGREKDDGCRECVTCRVRRYRSDPDKRERDREASRRWKREHLGQPGMPKAA